MAGLFQHGFSSGLFDSTLGQIQPSFSGGPDDSWKQSPPAWSRSAVPFGANGGAPALQAQPNVLLPNRPVMPDIAAWDWSKVPIPVAAQPLFPPFSPVEYLDSSRIWPNASSPSSIAASASGQWTAAEPARPLDQRAPAMSLLGAQGVPPFIMANRPQSLPPRSYSIDESGDRRGLDLVEQAQQRPDTLSPQQIENICKIDPAQHAAEFANRWLPGVGKVDPMTGKVRTQEWVEQQAYDMQRMIEQIQRQLRCAPI